MNVINGGKVTVTLTDYDIGTLSGRFAIILECNISRDKPLGTIGLGIVCETLRQLINIINLLHGKKSDVYGLKTMLGTDYEAVYRETSPGHGVLTFLGMDLGIEGEINALLKKN